MADPNTLPPALSRALELIAEPRKHLDSSNGYLDLIDTQLVNEAPANQYGLGPEALVLTGRIDALRQAPGHLAASFRQAR